MTQIVLIGSLSICAHSVAVAQVNGKLEEFISVVIKEKRAQMLQPLLLQPCRVDEVGKPTIPAEACTRVAMSVGAQVVSNVHSVGAASCATQNASTNPFHVAPFFSSPSASSMTYPYSHFPPSPAYVTGSEKTHHIHQSMKF